MMGHFQQHDDFIKNPNKENVERERGQGCKRINN